MTEIIKIELGENDAVFNAGTPKMVNLTITLSDGKRVSFPYAAKKSIAALYKEVRENMAKLMECQETPARTSTTFVPFVYMPSIKKSAVELDQIERNDIVTCIKVLDRSGDDVDIKVNGEYRILDIYKDNGVVTHYDVIDDLADTRRRITVWPSEICLLKKAKPMPQKFQAFEMIIKCECGEDNALYLEDKSNMYVGQCTRCNCSLQVQRKETTNAGIN